ncbi:cyclase family protein [Caldithrix abyssi]
MNTVIDLSHPIVEGMPLFPGTLPIKIKQLHVVEKDGFAEKQVTITTHVGTHLDAPAHMEKNGKTVDQLPVQQFWGSALVVDVRPFVNEPIPADLIENVLNDDPPDFLLLYTAFAEKWGAEDYFGRFPVLSLQATDLICNSRLKGIGLDAPSVDAMDAQVYRVHQKLFAAEKIIVENLTNLHTLPPIKFWFGVFPLKVKGADGMPVRAVAILNGE